MHWPITPKEGDIDKGEDIFAFFNSFISCLVHPRAAFPSAVRSPLKRLSSPLCSDQAKPPTGQNSEDGEVVCDSYGFSCRDSSCSQPCTGSVPACASCILLTLYLIYFSSGHFDTPTLAAMVVALHFSARITSVGKQR